MHLRTKLLSDLKLIFFDIKFDKRLQSVTHKDKNDYNV